MALNLEMAAALGGMDASRIRVEPKRCISVRNRNAACQRCVAACAGGALHVGEDGAVSVDAGKCMGCGTCANACPTDAIVLEHPSVSEVAAAFKRSAKALGGYAVACCERAARAHRAGMRALQEAGVCVVPCLGHVDEALLVEQAARRERGVVLVHAGCASCAHQSGGDLCARVCEDASALLSAFDSPCMPQLVDVWPDVVEEKLAARCGAASDDAAPASTFFGKSCDGGAGMEDGAPDGGHAAAADGAGADVSDGGGAPGDAAPAAATASAADAPAASTASAADAAPTPAPAADAAPAGPGSCAPYWKVGDDGTLSHCIPLARTRLYNCLAHLGAPAARTVRTRLVGRVEVEADKCMSCRMCAVFCPTGALRKSAPEKPFGLLHRPSLCMQCRCCEQICPKDALHVADEMPVDAFLSREASFIELPKPTWTPNTPTSMYDRFADMIGRDLETGHF